MRDFEFAKCKSRRKNRLKFSTKKELKNTSAIYKETTFKVKTLRKGSVWGIEDVNISFGKGRKRKKEHIKDVRRPCLVLKTPSQFNRYSKVLIAPGSTKVSNFDLSHTSIITATVPPEVLNKTTYFKLKFIEFLPQVLLEKRYCDLSKRLIDEIEKYIK
jgi:hypothetical protein